MMAKFYRSTSRKLLDIFKSRIVNASKADIPLDGYKERRFQELFVELYGKGNYKIEKKADVYIKNGNGAWIHLCKIKITPAVNKEEPTLKQIVEKHAEEYVVENNKGIKQIPTDESSNNKTDNSCYFKNNYFVMPQLFSVASVGLNYEVMSKECDWTINDYEHKKTGAQLHAKPEVKK